VRLWWHGRCLCGAEGVAERVAARGVGGRGPAGGGPSGGCGSVGAPPQDGAERALRDVDSLLEAASAALPGASSSEAGAGRRRDRAWG